MVLSVMLAVTTDSRPHFSYGAADVAEQPTRP